MRSYRIALAAPALALVASPVLAQSNRASDSTSDESERGVSSIILAALAVAAIIAAIVIATGGGDDDDAVSA